MTRILQKFFVLIFISLILNSCLYDEGEINCDEVNITYSNSVAKIIEKKCNNGECHSQGAYTGDFTSYEGLKQKITDGAFRSRVLEFKIMPPISSDPLSKDELGKITCWLESGAKND